MSQNPNDETISQLLALIAQTQTALNTTNAQLQGQKNRLAQWLATYRGPGNSQEADAAIADATRWIATHEAEIAQHQARLNELNNQLEQARKAKDAFDAALAEAAREGLTGEAAVLRAQGLMENQKGKTFLLVAVGVALLLLLSIYIYRKYVKA